MNRSPASILVINFTRMGDLIQTGPLISGLRRKHPGARIGLLVAASFAGIARLLPDVDEVFEWDQDMSVAMLMDATCSLPRLLGHHREWARNVRGEGWDLVINVTHSRDSAVLAPYFSTGEQRGICLLPNGHLQVNHQWAKYFFCVTGNRAINQINLVDIYRRIGDLAPDEGTRLSLCYGPGASRSLDGLLSALPDASPLVLIQPGASKENRRWPVRSMARAIRRLHEHADAAFAIVGSPSEAELADELLGLLDGVPALSVAGRTSLEELTALCDRAELLLSNDTGTLHVAASQGTPSVSLFLATALPWETGPWLPGCLILHAAIECAPCSHHVDCPHVMCRDWIHPDTVSAACEELLSRTGLCAAPNPAWLEDHRVRVWESRRDTKTGMLDLQVLNVAAPEFEEVVGRLYRHMWIADPGKVDPPAFGQEWREWLDQWPGCSDLSGHEQALNQLIGKLESMARLAGQGVRWIEQIETSLASATPDQGLLERAMEGLQDLDRKLFDLELSHPDLRPVGVLFRFDKESMDTGSPMEELNRAMRASYAAVVRRCQSLVSITGQALAPAHEMESTPCRN